MQRAAESMSIQHGRDARVTNVPIAQTPHREHFSLTKPLVYLLLCS